MAMATPVAEYLSRHDCPAYVFPLPPSFKVLVPTAAVLVPVEFLHRAQHIWRSADILGDLTQGEPECLATGRLSGEFLEPHAHEDAA
jgi:hypothetical protein